VTALPLGKAVTPREGESYPLIGVGGEALKGAAAARSEGWMSTATPKSTVAMPMSRVRPTPCRQFFSARKTTAMPAIQARTEPDCAALAGGNLLCVLRAAESAAVSR
jgi:hypothetical protein